MIKITTCCKRLFYFFAAVINQKPKDPRMKLFIVLGVSLFIAMRADAQKENNRIDSLMSSIYQKDKPGAAIAIVKNGKVVFRKGYGIADLNSKKPITPSTNFNICSMTKQFTAYGILQLQSRKKLSVDDRLTKYFPKFTPTIGSTVSIRNLLSHNSGIVDHYSYVDKKQFTEFWDKDVLTAIQSVDTVYFPCGTHYRYSNTAFCLLSLVIEQLSGKSYPEYMRTEVLGPLNMKQSDIIHPDFKIANRAFGYEFEKGTFKISDAKESLFFSTMGDGGLYTSIDDYLKWILAIQQGKGLDPAIVHEAQSAHMAIDSARGLSYGYGWFVAGQGDAKVVYHPGSNGGFRTIVFTKPNEKYSVVIFSNRTGVDLEDLIRTINSINNIDDKAYVKLEGLIS
jgi:D-alanyl-D-alanine carboxypeptidase